MYLTLIYNALIVFFLCTLYGRDLNLSGPVLVDAGCSWFTSCCGGSSCCNNCGSSSSNNKTGDTNKQSTKSESGFSLDISSPKDDDPKYNHSKVHARELHIFRINSQCTEIKCDSKEVWKRSTSDKTNPSRVRYDKENSEVTIYFGESMTKTFKKEGNEWKEKNQQTGTDQTGTTGTGGTGTKPASTGGGGGQGGGTGGKTGTGGGTQGSTTPDGSGGGTGTGGQSGGTGTGTGTGGGDGGTGKGTGGSGTTPGSPTSGGQGGTTGTKVTTGTGGSTGGGTGTKGKTT